MIWASCPGNLRDMVDLAPAAINLCTAGCRPSPMRSMAAHGLLTSAQCSTKLANASGLRLTL